MQQLIICRGVPASGKSTFAQAWVNAAANRIRVNRDDIRFQTYGVYHGGNVNEDTVTKMEDALIAAALDSGASVIVDDTNIRHAYVKRIAAIGYKRGAKVKVHQFDISLDEAKRRNALRDRKVPDEVIEKMHKSLAASGPVKLEPFEYEPYVPLPDAQPAVMFDVDGTLATMNGRSPFEWSRVDEDEVVEAVAEAARAHKDHGYDIVIMSGRDSECYSLTLNWLIENGIPVDYLFMRSFKDMRPDNIVKHELFNTFVRYNFDVLAVYDDRDQVVDMWRAIGLPCFQVAPGAF